MRANYLVVGTLAFLLGACSGAKGRPAPPAPLDKGLLAGKWKNTSDLQFISAYEFADDGTAKVTLRGLEPPVPARYTWTDERGLALEYQAAPDAQRAFKAAAKLTLRDGRVVPLDADVPQAYKAAVTAYRDELTARVKEKKLIDRAVPSLLAEVPDELPPKETFRVFVSDQPRSLLLTLEGGGLRTFAKAE
jgi:hypothetical protein